MKNGQKYIHEKIIIQIIQLFNSSIGIQIDLSKCSKPIDFFLLYFDEKLMSDIVLYSNEYYKYINEGKETNRKSHVIKWKEITIDDLKKYLGIILLMGIVDLPLIDDYWCTNKMLSNDFFRRIFSRDRLRQIHKFIAYSDIKTLDNDDKLSRVRPIANNILEKCLNFYTPSQKLSLDESMIGFTGNNPMKQYMANKPIKFGFKVFAICEANSGYIWNFRFYKGKENENEIQNLMYEVVNDLTYLLRNKNHIIYMDRYYPAVKLISDMKNYRIFCVGTIMKNRKNLSDVNFRKLDINESQYYKNKNKDLLFIRWKDKKNVFLLSNFHVPKNIKVQRKA